MFVACFQYTAEFIRLGRLERIHPLIQQYAAEKQTKQFTTVKELTRYYTSKVLILLFLGKSSAIDIFINAYLKEIVMKNSTLVEIERK